MADATVPLAPPPAEASAPAPARGGGATAVPRPHLPRRWLVTAFVVLAAAIAAGALLGPAHLPWRGTLLALVDRLPLVHVDSGLSERQLDILWQIRMPRVVLGAIVGAMLAGAGAAYQGTFQNPLADPYLLGAAAGAGLGATLALVYGPGRLPVDPVPLAAFVGAIVAVAAAYTLGTAAGGRGRASSATILLAGIAVTAFFTATQTYVQQRHDDTLRRVYSWILGRLTTATWSDVTLVLPYAAVATVVLLVHRRHLDVLRVGEDETEALGVPAARVRFIVVAAATLGTAAAVSVSGLIAFVGIIVPHTVRLLVGASYRVVLPLSLVFGAGFLVLADVVARTVAAPAEIPIGVITAFVGAPFFLLVLRTRRGERA